MNLAYLWQNSNRMSLHASSWGMGFHSLFNSTMVFSWTYIIMLATIIRNFDMFTFIMQKRPIPHILPLPSLQPTILIRFLHFLRHTNPRGQAFWCITFCFLNFERTTTTLIQMKTKIVILSWRRQTTYQDFANECLVT